MKRILSMLLCAAILICCASLCVFAEEQTTQAEVTTQAEETTEAEASEQTPTHIVFNQELVGKKNLIVSQNHMVKGAGNISKSGEWPGVKIEVSNPEDPHVAVDVAKFFKKFGFDPLTVEATPVIVIKVLAEEIAFDDFEIYCCAGDVLSANEDCRFGSDVAFEGENQDLYFIYNLTGKAAGEYHSLRVDLLAADEGALSYMTDIVFFENEEAALEWSGYYNQPTEEPTTEEPTTEAETEQETEAQTKKPAATTEAEQEAGCGSVIGAGLVALSLIALGAVCIKKRD